jgi:hypothetical protein
MTALDDFFTHYYSKHPVNATFTGVHAYDEELPDWSLDGLAALDDEMQSLGASLAAEYPAPASVAAFRSSPDLLDAELARGYLEIQCAENRSRHGPPGNPALWTGEAVFSIVSLMIRDFAPVEERFDLALARLDKLARFLHGLNTLHSAASLAPTWIGRATRDCNGADVLFDAAMRQWIAPAAIEDRDRARLYDAFARGRVRLRAFGRRLSATASVAAQMRGAYETPASMACGPDFFDLLLKRGHFCTRSRADLLKEARERFEAARAELDALAESTAGSWAQAQAQIAADRPTSDEYYSTFEKTWQACYGLAESANVISWPENWPIRYVPYPPFTADAAPHLYYLHYRSPAPFDPVSVRDYVVPALPSEPEAADKHLRVWNNSTIKLNHVVHHGAIGHHVQNWYAYNQQRSRIGKVAGVDCANRIGMFCGGTMTEGWACYATDLMEELGFLTPLERVAQQHTRVRLLARAIVDIEFHQGTMAFADAIAFYSDHVGMSADAARGEVVKNSMFPCTAIMYWLGTQGIHDLRDEMKRREGPRFSLRRFHGELLGYGSIPVPLLARMMTE